MRKFALLALFAMLSRFAFAGQEPLVHVEKLENLNDMSDEMKTYFLLENYRSVLILETQAKLFAPKSTFFEKKGNKVNRLTKADFDDIDKKLKEYNGVALKIEKFIKDSIPMTISRSEIYKLRDTIRILDSLLAISETDAFEGGRYKNRLKQKENITERTISEMDSVRALYVQAVERFNQRYIETTKTMLKNNVKYLNPYIIVSGDASYFIMREKNLISGVSPGINISIEPKSLRWSKDYASQFWFQYDAPNLELNSIKTPKTSFSTNLYSVGSSFSANLYEKIKTDFQIGIGYMWGKSIVTNSSKPETEWQGLVMHANICSFNFWSSYPIGIHFGGKVYIPTKDLLFHSAYNNEAVWLGQGNIGSIYLGIVFPLWQDHYTPQSSSIKGE